MKKVAVILVSMIALAGCGGTKTVTQTTTVHAPPPLPGPLTIAGHPCTSQDYAMQCALTGQTPTLTLPQGASTSARGIDFAWSRPSVAGMKAIGATFGASYFSHDASKNWTVSLVSQFHKAGIGTVAVWESSSTRAEQGPIAGAEDALSSKALATAVGDTTGPIDYAVDCDCSGASIRGYFIGLHANMGHRDNAYGGYNQVNYLHHAGLVGNLNWQTYAWSNGLWLPASVAPLEQYLNGSTYDYDRAIAPNYGQWPAPKVQPAKLICFGHGASNRNHTCRAVVAKVNGYSKAASASKRVYDGRGCPVLAQRVSYFSNALSKHPRTKVAQRKSALRVSRREFAHRNCGRFGQRNNYFTNKAHALQSQYS